ncbi:MAG: ketosteroid isomerase-like protein [Crocinitomix sp.]|jgi:ketosteroid isomerase-like protein
MRYLGLLGLLMSSLIGFSGENISEMMRNFYAALNKGDSTDMVDYFHPNCRVKHVGDKDVWDLPLSEFFGVCPKFKSDYYSEDINQLKVHEFESGLVYADVYFDFYVEGTYSHSGLDHFCLTKRGGELKIESVYSSDFNDGFPKKDDKTSMDAYLNKWHKDVADFDYDAYFNFMSEGFIYLGTDPSERWTKSTFSDFCKPYFERKSTWDFKTNWRNWYFSDDQNIAWFEESLDTQMEDCRGSGVLKKVNGEWKIAHYNLAVVIENKKMKKFLKLRRKR